MVVVVALRFLSGAVRVSSNESAPPSFSDGGILLSAVALKAAPPRAVSWCWWCEDAKLFSSRSGAVVIRRLRPNRKRRRFVDGDLNFAVAALVSRPDRQLLLIQLRRFPVVADIS